MLTFQPVQIEDAQTLYRYYRSCTYRLCEYSVGVKLMWRRHWHPEFAQSHGCLIVLNHSAHSPNIFDFPVPLPGEGDVDAALEDIDQWCMAHELTPAFGVVPAEERERLMARYPYVTVDNDRLWQDYYYRPEDLALFAGRRYSGQRNHINKFRRLYPGVVYRPLGEADREALERFWETFHSQYNKQNPQARIEVCYARELMGQVGREWVRAGALELDGEIIAVSLGEVCGKTLVCHVEKALPQYEGVYPAMVQAFAADQLKRSELAWINREDDAGEQGLRTSKLQYLPAEMGAKLRFRIRSELSLLDRIPTLAGTRVTLGELEDRDAADYDRLCLDDERNRWWGYDYREDLKGELTPGYFLEAARRDFAARQAVNFAVRLGGRFIGEAVLYRFDYKGGAELGCRILPEYGGSGYGAEAFRLAAEWSLYKLGLYRLTAKCFKENEPSRRMLAASMRQVGEDETYFHFEKVV